LGLVGSGTLLGCEGMRVFLRWVLVLCLMLCVSGVGDWSWLEN
jgi:hypothetical protein